MIFVVGGVGGGGGGVGGGFVYAKNVHGKATYARQKHVTLTELNAGAVTRRDYTYSETDNDKKEWELSK